MGSSRAAHFPKTPQIVRTPDKEVVVAHQLVPPTPARPTGVPEPQHEQTGSSDQEPAAAQTKAEGWASVGPSVATYRTLMRSIGSVRKRLDFDGSM